MSRTPDWLDPYRREVERWNASINLVSRQDTSARVDRLIGQCLDAVEQLVAAPAPLGFVPGGEFGYFDLGSGGGLPGVAWHGHLARAGGRPRTWLVEPREKRGWFLARVAREQSPEPAVLHGLWGEVATGAPLALPRILISLKALHLDDEAVLDGLRPCLAGSPVEVTIARFYPHDLTWDAELATRLTIAAPGVVRPLGDLVATASAAGVLPPARPDPEAASLVVSRYHIQPA